MNALKHMLADLLALVHEHHRELITVGASLTFTVLFALHDKYQRRKKLLAEIALADLRQEYYDNLDFTEEQRYAAQSRELEVLARPYVAAGNLFLRSSSPKPLPSPAASSVDTFKALLAWRRAELDSLRWLFFPLLLSGTTKEFLDNTNSYFEKFDWTGTIKGEPDKLRVCWSSQKGAKHWECDLSSQSSFVKHFHNMPQRMHTFSTYFRYRDRPSEAECALWAEVERFLNIPATLGPAPAALTVTGSENLAQLVPTPDINNIIDQLSDLNARRDMTPHENRSALQIFLEHYEQLEQTAPKAPKAPSLRATISTEIENLEKELDTHFQARVAALHQLGEEHFAKCRARAHYVTAAAYREWEAAWQQARAAIAAQDPQSPLLAFADDAYIAASDIPAAQRIKPPLLEPPEPGHPMHKLIPAHLWWSHHVTYTRYQSQDHLFLGCLMAEPGQPGQMSVDYGPKKPFLLHQKALNQHCYVAGPTGSGKTSIFVLPTIIQLIYGYQQSNGQWSPKVPVVIIDLAGDAVLFQSIKAATERRGQVFRFFSTQQGHASHRFNPFRGFDRNQHSPTEISQMILDALNLNYGPGYGRAFFSKRAQDFLTEALIQNPNLSSFRELSTAIEALPQKGSRFAKAKQDAYELISTINTLTGYDQLITAPGEDQAPDAIFFPRVLSDCEVAYFWLPSPLASISTREIGGLILFNLRAAAIDRKMTNPGDPRHTYLFIDEFQRLAGENFTHLLQQARHQNISVILANQAFDELKLPTGIDLRPGIRENTAVKVFFDLPQRNTFRLFNARASGETPVALQFPSPNSLDSSSQYTEAKAHTTGTGQSNATGTTESTAITQGKASSTGTTQSTNEFTATSSGIATTTGSSTTKGTSQLGWLLDPVTRLESQSKMNSTTVSASSTAGRGSSRGTTQSQSTMDSQSTGTAKTQSETRSQTESQGNTVQWPTFGTIYSGFAVHSTWHISEAERDRCSALPWPPESSITRAPKPAAPPSPLPPTSPPPDAQQQAMQQKLLALGAKPPQRPANTSKKDKP